jgi:DNA-directed RNA polymerase subunit omega
VLDFPGSAAGRAAPTGPETDQETSELARITVEDCVQKIPNRFELVRVAALRTKQLHRGARPVLSSPNREVVTSLREIAEGHVRPAYPEESTEEAPGS